MPPARHAEGWGLGRVALGAERTNWRMAGRPVAVDGTRAGSLPEKYFGDPAFINAF
jgi:hypothetical protein